MDHERLLNDAAARYVRIKQQRPDLSPDELLTLIVDRMGLDAKLNRGTVENDEGWSTIQRFVSAMEYFEDEERRRRVPALVDVRGARPMTSPPEPTEGAPRPMVDTARAAEPPQRHCGATGGLDAGRNRHPGPRGPRRRSLVERPRPAPPDRQLPRRP